jgi:hypothetical protein
MASSQLSKQMLEVLSGVNMACKQKSLVLEKRAGGKSIWGNGQEKFIYSNCDVEDGGRGISCKKIV